MKQLLITRPSADAQASAAALKRRGYKSLCAPSLEISFKSPVIDAGAHDVVLVTSRQAARALAPYKALHKLRCYAVGEATAQSLREAGFKRVFYAAGTARDLAQKVRAELPATSRLLIACAPSTSRSLQQTLKPCFASVARRSVYDVQDAAALPDAAVKSLKSGQISHVLFYSSRSARSFMAQARRAGCISALKTAEALCLSAKVAKSLHEKQWKAVSIAERPHEGALHHLLPAVK